MGTSTANVKTRQRVEEVLAAHESGDEQALLDAYAEDAITEWPQSGEVLVGGLACANVARRYPGGPPVVELVRMRGSGRIWVAETLIHYPGGETWNSVSIFELRDGRIARRTDLFGEPFDPPAWRADLVQVDPARAVA